MRSLIYLFLFSLLSVGQSFAQVSLTNSNTSVLIDFQSSVSGVCQGAFAGSGLQPSPGTGQLDGDAWAITGLSDGSHNFGQSNTSGDFARGLKSSGTSSGGLYSFNTGSNNYGIGVQPTGSDWTPGTITLKITNNGTSSISQLSIGYTVYVRNDQDRSNSFNFSHSANNSSYTNETSLDLTSPSTRDGSPSWVANNKSINLGNLAIAPGASYYLRWSGSDAGGSGSRDEFALDDISIQSGGNSGSNCVEPNAQATNLNFGNIGSNFIQGSFSQSSADNHLVLISTSSSLSANPIDGVNYAPGNSIGNATVVQYSNSNQFNAQGLQGNTNYTVFIFAANDNCTGAPEYRTTNPLSASASTLPNSNTGYYSVVGNQVCADLKTVLYNLIKDHTTVSYNALWTVYQSTDDRQNDNGNQTILWDMYSDNPNGSENEFTFVSDQCGTYQTEGDCYNREHSFPKSWWGGATNVPMYTDIFTVVPADGWINGVRNNNPYGEVQGGTETQITNNGSRLGSSSISIPGYSASVFEPIDEYKGDFARGYFYMATRYENLIAGWEGFTTESDAVLDGSSYPAFEPWMVTMLLDWHNNDPVSQKEIERNETIFGFQGNRNPFIDHPEYAGLIWGSCGGGGTTDTQAPSNPANLTASNTTQTSTNLSWSASSDNVGVSSYNIYQNGSIVAVESGTSRSLSSLSPGTTYNFYVTAVDAAGNESGNSNSISVTTDSPAGPTVLSEGYFESGWDGWQDGGSDCYRYSGSYAAEGNYAIRIRDNSGTASAMTSPSIDLTSYTSAEISFSFIGRGMEVNEDFWVRYYNGSSWTTIQTYARGTDFNNDIFYTASVTINSSDYNFASNARFRLQCDASVNNDQIYIDEVIISGGNSPAARRSGAASLVVIESEVPSVSDLVNTPTEELENDSYKENKDLSVYPNPASDWLTIEWGKEEIIGLEIFHANGQLMQSINPRDHQLNMELDLSDYQKGIYFLRVIRQSGTVASQLFMVQ